MNLAIIENRIDRLRQFSPFDISKEGGNQIITGRDFSALMEEVANDRFQSLEKFSCIAWHQSTLSPRLMDNVKKFCGSVGKPLIFFSGGVTSSQYLDEPFPYLNINSKDFYSENLRDFLSDLREGRVPNLLKVQFGLKWKLSILLSLRDKLQRFLNEEIFIQAGLASEDFLGRKIRLNDLEINRLIENDLNNQETADILKKDEFESLSTSDLKALLQTTSNLIDRMI